MTLEYKIEENSMLNSEDIIKRILFIIEQRKYGVLQETAKSVEFNNQSYSGGIVDNREYVNRMKWGRFEVINNEDSNTVALNYLPISLTEYIWYAILSSLPIGLGIIEKAYLYCFLPILFLVQLIYKYYNVKNIANEMLAYVTKS